MRRRGRPRDGDFTDAAPASGTRRAGRERAATGRDRAVVRRARGGGRTDLRRPRGAIPAACGSSSRRTATGGAVRMTLKSCLKAAARGAAQLAIAPLLPAFVCRRAVLGRDRALEGSIQWLSLIPGLSGQYIRRAFLTHALDGCHETAVVECGTTMSRAGTRLDAYAYVGPGCRLGLVHIERDVLIA